MLAKQRWRTSIRIYSTDTYFDKSLHLTRTLAARCPNAKLVPKNSLCFMEKIIFQLLSCLYLYDSGFQVPVRIRKQSQYTDVWLWHTVPPVYRLPTPQGSLRKPVYRRATPQGSLCKAGIPASDVLMVNLMLCIVIIPVLTLWTS